MMKVPSLCALLAVLGFPATASSAVLVGFHDFITGAASENHDVAATHFSATVVKDTDSRDTGGSDDGFYGNSALTVPTITGGDGTLRILGTLTINVSHSVAATAPAQLEALYFDATYTTSTTGLAVSYRINGGAIIALTPNPFGAAGAGITAGNDTPQAYDDFSRSLTGVTLNPGDSISLIFTSSSARVDNIALVGTVPEPSVLVSSFLGISLLARRRRGP